MRRHEQRVIPMPTPSDLPVTEEMIKAEHRAIQIQHYRELVTIPARFSHATLALTQGMSDEQKAVFNALTCYANNMATCLKRGAGLFLVGNVGTGKTYAACALCYAVINHCLSARYTTSAQFFHAMKATFHPQSSETTSRLLSSYASFELLVIDEVDIGCGSQQGLSEFEHSTLFQLINARYEACLPTVVIANTDLTTLKQRLGERIFDRLQQHAGVLAFNWSSLRGSTA